MGVIKEGEEGVVVRANGSRMIRITEHLAILGVRFVLLHAMNLSMVVDINCSMFCWRRMQGCHLWTVFYLFCTHLLCG